MTENIRLTRPSGLKHCSRSRISYQSALGEVSLADVLHRSLKRGETVTQLIFTGLTEAEVLDVTQIRHPEENIRILAFCTQTVKDIELINHCSCNCAAENTALDSPVRDFCFD